jgi:hypothetical protein
MKLLTMLGLSALLGLVGSGVAAAADGASTKLFACAIGGKTVAVAVTAAGGRLVYRYGTADKEELSIVGDPAAGNIFQMSQRFAGMEYQLRFSNGDVSYIVYSSEGNARTGAAATSGLVVMRGGKRISDRSCSRVAQLVLPAEALAIPEDTDAYSAM